MTSVERLAQYADLPPEIRPGQKQLPPPSSDWPQHGAIKFDKLRYAHYPKGPDILRGLSFEIKPREKVSHGSV